MFLSKLFNTSTLKQPSADLIDALTGNNSTAAGKAVTPDNALRVASVYACVRVLSETLSALPLNIYRKTEGGREVATDHPLQTILHALPNDEMTAMDFRVQIMASLLLQGNSFNEVYRTRGGEIGEIIPLPADKILVDRSKTTGKLVFELHDGERRTINNRRMWRIAGLGTNGIIGLSPIGLMRESIGIAMATEEHAARMFSNGAKPGGILEHPGKLSGDAQKLLIESWNKAYQGPQNANKVALLQEGMKWHQIGMTAEDAQFIESRKYQRSEIAGIFGVPPHMIADLEKATFSNIEHQSIQFVVFSLLPWMKRIEQSIFRDLLQPGERQSLYAEHNAAGLLRGDSKARSEFYRNLFNVGAININDIRRLENMNDIGEGGDKHWLQLNMAPIDEREQEQQSNEQNEISEPDSQESGNEGQTV